MACMLNNTHTRTHARLVPIDESASGAAARPQRRTTAERRRARAKLSLTAFVDRKFASVVIEISRISDVCLAVRANHTVC